MPGARQNIRSAPQKQPIPKIACSALAGKGGLRGVPRTRCFAGTRIASSRPGSASSGDGIAVDLRVKSMPVRYRRRWVSLRLRRGLPTVVLARKLACYFLEPRTECPDSRGADDPISLGAHRPLSDRPLRGVHDRLVPGFPDRLRGAAGVGLVGEVEEVDDVARLREIRAAAHELPDHELIRLGRSCRCSLVSDSIEEAHYPGARPESGSRGFRSVVDAGGGQRPPAPPPSVSAPRSAR